MYIKALEQEVLRLKEVYTTTVRERDAIADENRRLKELLAAHGITYELSTPGTGNFPAQSSYGSSSAGSVSGSGYGPGSTSTGYTSPPSHPPPSIPDSASQQAGLARTPNGVDYDQIGIDFVLTYGRTPYLSPPPQ
jgi:hypothetical protein